MANADLAERAGIHQSATFPIPFIEMRHNMILRNIPLSILGKVLLELVAHGLLFNAVYDEHSETVTINFTGGY